MDHLKASRQLGASVAIALMYVAPCSSAKTLIDYFQPIPIVGRLSTTVWGAAAVGPRDPSNGIEDPDNYYYWDGKIIKAGDGEYHLFASRWPKSSGVPGWECCSVSVHATSDNVIGPYTNPSQTYTYQNGKGHNTTGLALSDGTYAVIESAIVPGWIFTASAITGPFNYAGSISWNGNGYNPNNVTSNTQIMIGPDGRFWEIGSSGFVLNGTNLLGPYQATGPSIYPSNIPGTSNNNAEDPIIWYSGGFYHVVYDYWNVRKMYHLMSADGVHDWKNMGLAVDPTTDFVRYTDGTLNHWYNMERPNVYMENGHVTHFTFAVSDINKNGTNPAPTSSKVIVIPFDGVTFDADNSPSAGGSGGQGGAAGAAEGGSGGGAGGSATGGTGGGAGMAASGGAPGTGGTAGRSGTTAAGGTTGSGGSSMGGTAGLGSGGSGGTSTSGAAGASGGRSGSAGAGGGTPPGSGGSSGCSCAMTGDREATNWSALLAAIVLAMALRRRRRNPAPTTLMGGKRDRCRALRLTWAALIACLSQTGCAPNKSVSMSGSGGVAGSSSTGGKGTGGNNGTGGQPGPGSGGTTATGGSNGQGGTTGSGGAIGSGGGVGSGGNAATGGAIGSGGSNGMAGATGSGGANQTGGAGGTAAADGPAGIQPDGSFVTTCPNLFQSNEGGLPALMPVPSPEQASYQHTELTAFIHFSLATFDGTEQGNTADKPTVFAPTNLTQDTINAWVTNLKAAGFRQAMLTAKHSIGFCLWPSTSTNNCNQYSVAQSGWMNGTGDVVKMWTDAMHANGMRVAMYLAPWDQHFPSTSSSYEAYLINQMTDLLTNYGPIYEIEFDGFNSPSAVNWAHVFTLARQLQPHILIWAGPEVMHVAVAANPPAYPTLQWIGNENGMASRSTSSRDLSNCATLANGTPAATNLWCAWETNVSDRLPAGDHWFWHPTDSPMGVGQMESIYFTGVGMNSTLIFNVPPSNTGAFDPKDVALLQQFGSWYSALYHNNTLKGQPTTPDSTWATAGFGGDKAVDEDVCTYWAAAAGKTSGRLEIDPPSPITFSVISIREPIELGERSTGYHVEIKQNGTWNTAPQDKSGTQIKGTVIGQRQLWQLSQTTADAIALVIDSARGVPAVAEFGAY